MDKIMVDEVGGCCCGGDYDNGSDDDGRHSWIYRTVEGTRYKE